MKEIGPSQIEITPLGRCLEGRGGIRSSLEDAQISEICEALKRSVRPIEEPDSSACGDGRQVVQLASGRPARRRPRKFGASLSPFNMHALADPEFLDALSQLRSADELYDACNQVSIAIGHKPAGHVGCGAGDEVATHNLSVAQMTYKSPSTKAVIALSQAILGPVANPEVIARHMQAITPRAAEFAEIMQSGGWSGAGYIERLAEQDGDCVEILKTNDGPLKGHAEDFIALVISQTDNDGRPLFGLDKTEVKTKTGREYFGVDLSELARDANQLGSDDESKIRHLVAGLMHHIGGVAYNLIDGSQPVILLQVH